MQIRKFYGRTASEALLLVKRSLGPEAMILETQHLESGNPAAVAHHGARFEICAAREENPAPGVAGLGRREIPRDGVPLLSRMDKPGRPVVNRGRSVVEDLAVLRAQVEQLLNPGPADGDTDLARADRARLDLSEYHGLIELGVDHRVLAPHFRSWLNWRTSSARVRQWLGRVEAGPAAQMRGESLREWLWRVWTRSMGLEEGDGEMAGTGLGTRVISLVGPTGAGKTTTLAKISSKLRQQERQKSVVITLDTFRFGATEQWKKISHLTGVPVIPVVTQEDLSVCIEKWDRFDWVGIDTPGGMTPESPAGRLYGAILAQYPGMETKLVLPATNRESVNREYMARSQAFSGANKVLFSKLDETRHNGSLVNLTLDSRWKIDGITMGQRVPEDWQPAGGRVLWDHIIAPDGEALGMGGIA